PNQDALAYDVAMQIAASNPRYIKPEEVATAELDKEKEVYREQLRNEGKPAEMIEKILAGKVNKYYEEVCLIKQEYIKDDKKKVADILGTVQVETFVRFSL
ncbi:MAG: elongation factor Ts, partial [bacterium]